MIFGNRFQGPLFIRATVQLIPEPVLNQRNGLPFVPGYLDVSVFLLNLMNMFSS